MNRADTIFGVSGGLGKAAIKICRISGPHVKQVVTALGLGPLTPRAATLRTFRRPDDGEAIDRGIAIFFPSPASFTGEDLLELHFHGGLAVEKAVLDALGRSPGCRLAEAGEFTWRGFLNGKIDLASAEALADLIDAETETQRKQAFLHGQGRLNREAERWREGLLSCLTRLEAAIDFEDEPDVPREDVEEILATAGSVCGELDEALSEFGRGEIIRSGYRVAILGPPNAGKSSLLNYLAGRNAAIVTSTPGTTRDVIEVHLDLKGIAIVMADTAGIRASSDEVERIGIDRALSCAAEGHLVLWLSEDGGPPPGDLHLGPEVLPVLTKSDLPGQARRSHSMPISTMTGEGLDRLMEEIVTRAQRASAPDRLTLLFNVRHLGAISSARTHLSGMKPTLTADALAECVRLGLGALEELVGRVDAEQVLEKIFSRFCIGK